MHAIMDEGGHGGKRGGRVRHHLPSRPVVSAAITFSIVFSLSITQLPAAQAAQLAWLVEGVEFAGPSGLRTSLALDEDGVPHIAYVDRASDTIRSATRNEEGWVIRIVDSAGGFTGDISLALDNEARPRISYFSGATGHLKYAMWNATSWEIHEISPARWEGHHSLALDRTGTPHIAYSYFNGDLKYTVWNGTGWSNETVDKEVITARFVSLALDSQDEPHFAYYGDGQLRYAWLNGTTWGTVVVDTKDYTGWFSRIALDSQDKPHIAYRDSLSRKLRHAWIPAFSSSWNLETVDIDGDTGWDVDIAIDDLDGLHLSYYERYDAELRYAYKPSVIWVVQTVDTLGVVGWYTSIALNEEGRPRISYLDWTNGLLKYAEGTSTLAVRTLTPASVTSSAGVLRGELVSLGDYSFAEVSFEWRTEGEVGWRATSSQIALSEGIFETYFPDLEPENGYEFRFKATANGEVVWGSVLNFTTLAPPIGEPLIPFQTQTLLIAAGVLGFLLGWVLYVVVDRFRKKRRKT